MLDAGGGHQKLVGVEIDVASGLWCALLKISDSSLINYTIAQLIFELA